MSEPTAADAAATTGAPATAVTESITDPGADKIAALKARRQTGAPPAPAAKPPESKPTAPPATTPAPTASTTPKTEAEVNISDAELKQFTVTQKEMRRLQAVNKQLEADAAEAATLKKYRELKAAGKHQEAADLIELDVDAVVAARLKSSIPPTPESQALDGVKKDVDALKTDTEERKKREADQAAANAAAAKEANSKTVVAFVGENKAAFPYLSRNAAWAATAYEKALGAYGTLPAADRPKTNDQREKFVRAFLDEAEVEHAANAKLYGAPEGTPVNHLSDRSNNRQPPAANGNRRAETPSSPNKKLTFEEVRYRRRNRK